MNRPRSGNIYIQRNCPHHWERQIRLPDPAVFPQQVNKDSAKQGPSRQQWRPARDPNGSCLFATGLPTDAVGSQTSKLSLLVKLHIFAIYEASQQKQRPARHIPSHPASARYPRPRCSCWLAPDISQTAGPRDAGVSHWNGHLEVCEGA